MSNYTENVFKSQTFCCQYTSSFQRSNNWLWLGASKSIQRYRWERENGKLENVLPGVYRWVMGIQTNKQTFCSNKMLAKFHQFFISNTLFIMFTICLLFRNLFDTNIMLWVSPTVLMTLIVTYWWVYIDQGHSKKRQTQGYNARKVISEVYTSFVLQCTVSGRQCKHKTDVESRHGIHLSHKKNQWNILVIGNYYVNYQNYQNSMLLTSSDTKRTLRHLFLFTNSAQRELVSICTQSVTLL